MVTDTTGADNTLTVRQVGTDVVITDAAQAFAPGLGVRSDGGRTLTLPTSAFAGKVIFNAGAGNDVLTVDDSGGVLELAGIATYAKPLTLNKGSTLRATGSATYSASGNPVIASGATVTFATVAGGDTLTIGSGYANAGGSTLTPTVVISGPGTVELGSGSGSFRGNWDVQQGTLKASGNNNTFGTPTAGGTPSIPGSTLKLSGGNLLVQGTTGVTFNAGTGPAIPVTVTANATISATRSATGAGFATGFGTLSIGSQALTFAYDSTKLTTAGDSAWDFGGAVSLSGNPTFRMVRTIAATRALPRFNAGMTDGGTARTVTFDNSTAGGTTDATEEAAVVGTPRSLLPTSRIDLTGDRAFRLVMNGASASDNARIRFANAVGGNGAVAEFRSDTAATFNNGIILDQSGTVRADRATGGAGVTHTLGNLTVNGTRTLSARSRRAWTPWPSPPRTAW